MLNSHRYQALKLFFDENGVVLQESDIQLYADMFEIIAQFINEKMTDDDMFNAFDFLSSLICGKNPAYALVVNKEDRIRIQLKAMEELPETRGKLTDDEKIKFAFCVYLASCVQIYDEASEQVVSGLVQFTSKENIEQELAYEMQRRPEFFEVKDIEKNNDPSAPFAYSIRNPVCTLSIPGAYRYLKQLRYKGKPVKYERIGCFDGPNGSLIDGYKLMIKPGLFAKWQERTIYIDSYANSLSKEPPEGFTLEE